MNKELTHDQIRKCPKAIIFGFEHPNTAPAFKNLQKCKLLELVAWFGQKKHGSHVTHEIFDYQGSTLGFFGVTQHPQHLKVYLEILEDDQREFMEMTARSYQRSNLEFYEYQNILAITAKFFLALLKDNDIEIIFFSNIPHEGPDKVVYRICRKLGIRTLVFTQSLFQNRYFYMEHIEGLGDIESNAYAQPYKVDRKFNKELFYMKTNKSRKIQIKALLARMGVSPYLVKAGLHVMQMKIEEASRENLLHQRWSIMNDQFKLSSTLDSISENFIYFPLHLQPELTTSALGGIFCDQLLAIELLAKKLPPKWIIVVKENPKQLLYRRDIYFYERLQTIPNILYLTEGDTYQLMSKAKLVATITGTAGWEAISGGKPVITFGRAWYRSLPGVYTYNDDIDLDMISQSVVNHAELEYKLGLLLSTCGFGVVDSNYQGLCPNFDPHENAKSIEAFIKIQLR